MKKHRPSVTVLTLILLALLIPACGGDSNEIEGTVHSFYNVSDYEFEGNNAAVLIGESSVIMVSFKADSEKADSGGFIYLYINNTSNNFSTFKRAMLTQEALKITYSTNPETTHSTPYYNWYLITDVDAPKPS